ncbi:MAG: hypothetical protein U1E10_08860 [Bdellovibrionales bacterium]|nr:hypothetical protein [Bdellovibrionales bacterium]
MQDVSVTPPEISIARDAFSSGQVGSKMWLAQLLETLAPAYAATGPHTIWIYGGWQGVMGFILLSRQASRTDFQIERIRSFDIDDQATEVANQICENWVWREWTFRAFTKDCDQLQPQDGSDYGPSPTIIINTSVEHFDNRNWFENIPEGTIVALQASDFEHEGAVALAKSDEAFAEAFPLRESWFSGALDFNYGSWSFKRRMRIGRK